MQGPHGSSEVKELMSCTCKFWIYWQDCFSSVYKENWQLKVGHVLLRHARMIGTYMEGPDSWLYHDMQ